MRSKKTMGGVRYEELHGSIVSFGGKAHQQPPLELLEHRIKFFEASQVESTGGRQGKGKGQKGKGKGQKVTRKLLYCKYCLSIAYSLEDLAQHGVDCDGVSSAVVISGKLGELTISGNP